MLDQLKQNLVLHDDSDDDFLRELLAASVRYAEKYQHVGAGFYATHPMPPTTRQAVIMLASHWYESRDGGTAGFFGDSPAAAEHVMKSVDNLLTCEQEWVV